MPVSCAVVISLATEHAESTKKFYRFDALSFAVEHGEVVALVGASGSVSVDGVGVTALAERARTLL
jgi:ABC-type dipeptide/oligopeptide/nickel transport system ATPase subunit